MKLDDAANGLIAVLLGALMLLGAQALPTPQFIAYGPGFFPSIVGGLLMAAGAAMIVRRLSAGGFGPLVRFTREGSAARAALSFGVVAAALFFYIATSKWLGFLPAMVVSLSVMLLWFDRRPLLDIGLAVAGTLVLHTFFYQFMQVQLPWGLLSGYAGTLTW